MHSDSSFIQETVTAYDIAQVMTDAQHAFYAYSKTDQAGRASFLLQIAAALESIREEAVAIAQEESHLPAARLNGELSRTTNQLKMFAALLAEGSWIEAAIDTDTTGQAAKPDLRKMLVPLGPVIVFGASNFPFAFSTAGGDTASALAAGCTVVIKGHPAHARTSALVFRAMQQAMEETGMPVHTIQHVPGTGNEVGKALVMHPYTAAVGFTGSFAGGNALVAYSGQREIPVPVFAEMSSINPVVFYPDTLRTNATALAASFAASITLGVGQFCTNPGLLIGIKGEGFTQFLEALAAEITKTVPQQMLHAGIHAAYQKGVAAMVAQDGLKVLGRSQAAGGDMEGSAVVAAVNGTDFLNNAHFTEEVFGPFSLAVICNSRAELIAVLQSLKGQLTSTMVASAADVQTYGDVMEWQHRLAGRIILNNPPTGVEVCASMVHGGPYPATTDARFTSVGSMAIKRWVRPVCLQNFTEEMLPDALKNNNPLGILRLVNSQYTRDPIQIGKH